MKDYLNILRPKQWLKNLMLYFPAFLGGTLFSAESALRLLPAFAAFCLVSSATYVGNDFFDRENDRHHPEKRRRPIASGRVTAATASGIIILLTLGGLLLARMVSVSFLLLLAAYLTVSTAYNIKLKHIVLVDIFCISAGFLLRLQAGGVVSGVAISEWLFLSVFLLSVFLSTGKRLSEKQSLGTGAVHHRKALEGYPRGFLEGAMYMTGGTVLVTYTMYVLSRHSQLLIYSVPLCCFGLLRYMLRILAGKGGDPTDSLTRDLPLLLVGAAWVCLVGWGIYG